MILGFHVSPKAPGAFEHAFPTCLLPVRLVIKIPTHKHGGNIMIIREGGGVEDRRRQSEAQMPSTQQLHAAEGAGADVGTRR